MICTKTGSDEKTGVAGKSTSSHEQPSDWRAGMLEGAIKKSSTHSRAIESIVLLDRQWFPPAQITNRWFRKGNPTEVVDTC
jgi:hypothetical protein